MKLKILAAAVMAAFGSLAHGFTPFVVKDIKVDGIQRTEAGTVFSYLPIKIGDTVTDESVAAAVKALYATGFFKDVRIEADGDTIVVSVDERPAIAQLAFSGNKEFDEAALRKGLKDAGISESRIFDRSTLERAEQELKRLYLTRSFYAVRIRTTVSPLERNRVAVNFEIEEGEAARIKEVRVIGAKVFSESRLLDLMSQTTTGWLSWFTKDDQYSKVKLLADQETIKSYYLNRGYLDFAFESTQVSITPDKKDVYITLAIKEGEQYKVSSVRLAGEMLVPEAELKALVQIKPGEIFSRQNLNDTSRKISDRLGNEGYAFANVNAAPEVDQAKREVALTFYIDPGRRAYVNRINIVGNSKTRDVVIRREFRQPESAWFDRTLVERSKERLTRTGYFEDVSIETVPVPNQTDLVDLNVEVKEKPTGNITLGAGYSQTEKFVLQVGISQDNVFGSGNSLAVQGSTGKVNRNISASFTNPYLTADGVSGGFDVYNRRVDPTSLDVVAKYKSEATGAGIRFGLPISEDQSVRLGLSFDHTRIETLPDSPPQYIRHVQEFGELSTTLLTNLTWADDRRDSVLYPTTGLYQRVSVDVAIPPAEMRYTRASYQWQRFFAMSDTFTLLLNADFSYGVAYGGNSYPFFKNYYGGGIGSVRGYGDNSLGPRVLNTTTGQYEAIGGTRRVLTGAELLFPFPGMKENSKTTRLSAFFDGGQVWDTDSTTTSSGPMRFSTGLALTWVSPLGPMKFSYGFPINKRDGDEVRRFQFQIGQVF
ncbi:outer membrane protein assembly factor BamA [Uliginosibacterium sp. H1]|uniref:outer membrane protein assembly factor BamA n=1 Tax=Uliginosibacterium sp. H1 TaxID=3114757 RepID=UPI002E19C975|nr:outer membrane protein assembly factor BamA [Uliginosibacterium sp. H1]